MIVNFCVNVLLSLEPLLNSLGHLFRCLNLICMFADVVTMHVEGIQELHFEEII